MKQTNHHIQALARKLFHHKQGLERPKLMHPQRDWLIGVLIGVVIIMVMIGWSAYTYLDRRDAIELEDSSIEAEIPVYKADLVEDALNLFAERKAAFAQLNQSSATEVQSPADLVDDIATSSATTSTAASTTTATTSTTAVGEEGVTRVAPDQDVAPALTPSNSTSESEESVGTPTLAD